MHRHDLDLVALVAGIVFAAVGLAFLLHSTVGLSLELRWAWPLLLIGVGVSVLVASRPR